MTTRIINLTPHTVNLETPDGIVSFDPSDTIARAFFDKKVIGSFRHRGKRIHISRLVVKKIRGLPDPVDGTLFIVSSVIQKFAHNRTDLLVPFRTIRRDGKVIACRDLLQI